MSSSLGRSLVALAAATAALGPLGAAITPTRGATSPSPLSRLAQALNTAQRAARRGRVLPAAAYVRIRRAAIAVQAAAPRTSPACRLALPAARRLPADRRRRARLLGDLRRARGGM